MLPRPALTFLFLALVCPALARAQATASDIDAGAPAHVSYVDGAVTLEREGRPENAPLNMPLLSGDRLRTLEGRAEVLFADASALHLDVRSTLDIQSDDLVRLIDGRLRLTIVGPARAVTYRIDSPAGSVRITQPGEYRVALLRRQDETQLEFAVVRGGGEIFTDEGSTTVRAGERAYASAGLLPSYPYAFNSANWDAFDRWAEGRRDTRLGVSSQYLPEDVRSYASTFDEYGDWRYQPAYGYVWYPRVAASWRPYYYGRWVSYPRYGWTWIGADGFAWPTHHYGRWGFSAGIWFWIPGARWAPAYVSWAYAPGYVSWCPLGFDNRPVIGVNIFRVGPGYYSSGRAWTAVAYSNFGRDYYVHQRAVNWDRWDARQPFQVGHTAPAARGVAVPRTSTAVQRVFTGADAQAPAPIRWAGRSEPARGGSYAAGSARPMSADTAVPRENRAPRYVNRGETIIRSQTERPTAPSRVTEPSAPADRAVVSRTAPSGEVARGGLGESRRATGVGQRIERPSSAIESPSREGRQPGMAAPGYGRAVPRSYDPRSDSPAYAPSYQPRTSPQAEAPAAQPRSYDPGSVPRRGEYDPGRASPPARSGGERQAPVTSRPAPSAAPAPSPSRGGGGGGGGERAVPRSGGASSGGGTASRPRGGRGGH